MRMTRLLWGAGIALFTTINATSAATIAWTNIVGGDWSAAANWSPNQVPGSGDDVLITADSDYTVWQDTGPIELSSLTIGGASGLQTLHNFADGLTLTNTSLVNSNGRILFYGGTLRFPGGLNVAGRMDWNYGHIPDDSSLAVLSSGVLNLSGLGGSLSGRLTNRGAILWSNGELRVGGEIWNEAGGIWEIQCDQTLNPSYPEQEESAGVIHNAGTIRKTATNGVTLVMAFLDNSGTIEAESGTILFDHSQNDLGGTIQADAGASILFTGFPIRLLSTVDFLGPGTSAITNSPVYLNNITGTVNLVGCDIRQGVVGGTLNLLSRSDCEEWWCQSSLGYWGFASLTILSNGVLNIMDSLEISESSQLTNRGTVNWQSGNVGPFVSSADRIDIWNESGALWDIQCDQWVGGGTQFKGYFHNAGTLRKSDGDGTATIDYYFDNIGAVEELSGDIQFTATNLFITRQPSGRTNAPGSVAVFRVEAVTPGEAAYQWRLNGADLPNETGPLLLLTNVQPVHAGDYSVVVSLLAPAYLNSITSSVAKLTMGASTDTTPPTLTVFTAAFAPGPALREVYGVFGASGSAHDNVAVEYILCSLNDQPLRAYPVTPYPRPGPFFGQWELRNFGMGRPGTNFGTLVAVDSAGNRSTQVKARGFYTVQTPLTVQTNGFGRPVPKKPFCWYSCCCGTPTNGAALMVNVQYSIEAVPDTNSLFTHWLCVTDGVANIVNTPKLTFVMQPGTTLTANFVTNAFPQAKGQYYGLFYESETNVQAASAGFARITVSSSANGGSCSGQLFVQGAKVKFAGPFDLSGNAHITNFSGSVPSVWPASLDLNLDLAGVLGGTNLTLNGTISNASPPWISTLTTDKAVWKKTINPCPLSSNHYTLILPGTPGGAGGNPVGDSYAAVTVSTAGSGQVTAVGKYADTSALLPLKTVPQPNPGLLAPAPTPLSPDLRYPFYTKLYPTGSTSAGLGIGWLSFTPTNIQGNVVWIRPGSFGGTIHAAGFTNESSVLSSRYVKPAAGTKIISLTACQLTLTHGGIAGGLTNVNNITMSAPGKFTIPATNNPLDLKMTLSAGNGTFLNAYPTFSQFRFPGNPIPATKFYGAVLQDQSIARGFFIGTSPSESGSVLLQAYP